MSFAQQLIEEVASSNTFPLEREQSVHDDVHQYRAIFHADADELRLLHKPEIWDSRDLYMPSGLPRKIIKSFVRFEFSEGVTFEASNESDQAVLDDWLAENDFVTQCSQAEEDALCDGAVGWRLQFDSSLSNRALFEVITRDRLIPMFRRGRLVALGIIAEYKRGQHEVWRHLEVHTAGEIRHALFLGSPHTIGGKVDLSDFEETADLPEVIEHELGYMSAGLVMHGWNRARNSGASLMEGAVDEIMALNAEQSNTDEASRMAVKRVFANAEAIGPDGTLDLRKRVVVVQGTNEGLDGGDKLPITEVGITYDAHQRVAYHDAMFDRICINMNFSPAIARNQGQAPSAAALKARYIDTYEACESFAQRWEREMRHIVMVAALMETHMEFNDDGDENLAWSNPAEPPIVQRGPVLPEGLTEVADALSKLDGVLPGRQKLREIYPGKSERFIDELYGELVLEKAYLASLEAPLQDENADTEEE